MTDTPGKGNDYMLVEIDPDAPEVIRAQLEAEDDRWHLEQYAVDDQDIEDDPGEDYPDPLE